MSQTEPNKIDNRNRICLVKNMNHESVSQTDSRTDGKVQTAGGPSPSPSPDQTQECLVGECVDAHHPVLQGRVLIRWKDIHGKIESRWLATLQNLPVREKDRVLLVKPGNWNEMIVTGVIDGFAKRPEIERFSAGLMRLQNDEKIQVIGQNGKEILDIYQADTGPIIRVLQGDCAVEFPGKFKLTADSIELEAGAGPINIKASDDVRINGEMIHLN
jgi:hypothetical protein